MGRSGLGKEFTLRIAEIAISFFLKDRPFEFDSADTRHESIGESGADLRLAVHIGSLPEVHSKQNIFDSGETWSLFRSDGKYVLQDDALKSVTSPETTLVLDLDFKSGDLYLAQDRLREGLSLDPLGYPLNQVLMILLLSMGKGIFLHACGIEDEGRGYLFLGHSGDGKSTIARLWSENDAAALNDDRIILRPKDRQFWMYSTPWHGDFKQVSSQGLVISKVFFLKRGGKNLAIPKKGADAVSMLLARSFPPFWDQRGMDYTIDLCRLITQTIPCYELTFRPDKEIINFVRRMKASASERVC